ncbi:MAG: hypothetical protein E6736_24870, partial [Leclercia adecarboxylata]|nr:hypothetical protein [Leclercia adecarboxylata]
MHLINTVYRIVVQFGILHCDSVHCNVIIKTRTEITSCPSPDDKELYMAVNASSFEDEKPGGIQVIARA